ncbi:MAG: MATE family efflux transporter [Candidatus Neomarinimicrobiota bacterium]
MTVWNPIVRRWRADAGYKQVLILAIPLILSTAAWSLQHFIDRMFLAWYSTEAIAAAMPAGLLNFTFMSLFTGTASYVSTFVAQYHGAGQHKMFGRILWQGIYIAIIGGIFHFGLIPLADSFFRIVGHQELVREYETIYFKYLCLGAFPAIAASALAGFYSGRGHTLPIMWINIIATLVNLTFDYILIFGHLGFPEMGMKGAAIATVLSALVSFLCYVVLIFQPKHNRSSGTLSDWRFDRKLFMRLIYFGFPNGIQFFLDIAGFTIFLLMLGRLGTIQMAATNVAFNINNLAFMPMTGFSVAVAVLVGQSLGKNRPDLARRSTYSCFHITLLYMCLTIAAFLLIPEIFIKPFIYRADPITYAEIKSTVMILLRFVALYTFFDTFNIIFSGAIKGAGDTRFVMYMLLVLSLGVLVIPSYIVIVILHKNLLAAWTCATIYISVLGLAFFLRFLGGKWQTMRVIETPAPRLPSSFPEVPTPDL